MQRLRIYLSIWILASCAGVYAQGGLKNEGASIQISSNTNIKITTGGVENLSDGNIANAGDIYLNTDWYQTGTTTDYTGNGTIHFQGNSNQYLTSSTALVINNLKVNNGFRLVLNSPVSIANNLDLMSNGSIELGNNNLTLLGGGTINNYNPSHFIITNANGSLIQQVGSNNTVFPVGNSVYNPATLNNNGTLDDFSVRVEDQVRSTYPSGSFVTTGIVDKTWFIDEMLQGGSDLNITLQWETSDELTTFDRSKSAIHHWVNNAWDAPAIGSPAINVGANSWTQSRSGITSFSPFSVDDIIPTSVPFLANTEQGYTLTLYPNPTKSNLTLKFSSVESQSALIQIFSATGQLLVNEQKQINANQSIQLLGLQSLTSGTYLLRAILDNGQTTSQLFVKN